MTDPRNHVGSKIGFDNEPRFKALALFIERIERAFWCVQGPPMAYFELPSSVIDGRGDTHVARMVYETIAYGTTKPITEEIVHELCEQAWNEVFQPVLDRHKAANDGDDLPRESRMLFWRRTPVVGQQNDGSVMLRMRCVVPGEQLVSYKRLAAVA